MSGRPARDVASSVAERLRTLWADRRVRMAVGIAAGVFAAVGLLDLATGSPRLCSSCHEMQLRSDEWARSAHASVKCVECHQPAREWYASPLKVVDRGRLLARDIGAHLRGGFDDPVDSAKGSTSPIGDEICLQCHDPNRKATSGFRILIDHAEHAKRNGSCVSCHVRTAHPIEQRSNALSLMSQCFTCHGQPKYPEASAECATCHPSGYELLPASHEPAAWKRSHGPVAKQDTPQCRMCHEQRFCDDCHGIAMPHPEGWAQGAKGHAAVAEVQRDVCGRCHGNRPDMCTMCHHSDYQPGRGTWVQQHYVEVRRRGTLYCLDCHAAPYCVRCHVRFATDGTVDDGM